MFPLPPDLLIPQPDRLSIVGRARRWIRRRLTPSGRAFARRLEACRP